MNSYPSVSSCAAILAQQPLRQISRSVIVIPMSLGNLWTIPQDPIMMKRPGPLHKYWQFSQKLYNLPCRRDRSLIRVICHANLWIFRDSMKNPHVISYLQSYCKQRLSISSQICYSWLRGNINFREVRWPSW